MSSDAGDRSVQRSRRGIPIPRRAGLLLTVLAIVAFLFFAFAELTPRESLLLGIFQTLFSLGAGWAITHAYAEDSLAAAIQEVEDVYQRNLKTYALKAAEKVENLSMQLVGLAAYLNEELDETSYRSVEDELAAKEERIYSAVHLLSVLKSVNDTSLSDWRGVIGEELDRRQEAAEEREEEFERILDQISSLEGVRAGVAPQHDAEVVAEVKAVREELRKLARTIGIPVAVSRKPSRATTQNFAIACPACNRVVSTSFKARPGRRKAVPCTHCDASLMLNIDMNGDASLTMRREIPERVGCPECTAELDLLLDEVMGATVLSRCTSCGSSVRVSRAMTGLRTSVNASVLTEEIVHMVQSALPSQPWPKGVHKGVSEAIGVPPNLVQRAIQKLIAKGVFMDQYEGVLCTTAEKAELMRRDRMASEVGGVDT